MAKQNIKLSKSELQSHQAILGSLEKTAEDQYKGIRSALDGIKACLDRQLASAIDESVNESLKTYKEVINHLHVGAWCIELVLKNSEVTDANCAAEIDKLIANPPPEKTIARCVYNGYKQYHSTGNYATREGSYVYLWNREGKEVSCTYHTLRRLRDKGLDYPFVNAWKSHGGGAWHQNCDTNLAEVRYGTNSIEQLIAEYECPLENIVIDFPGHVMLIDRVYREDNGVIRVDFSDMGSRTEYGVFQTDLNSRGFEYYGKDGWTLERFKSSYEKSNGGGVLAATLIGKAP